ncbi:hypothetical protein [Pantoea ananatis]|uniref:hypothetical protein n=1 Tax=Pantoea ananas TaxID=553 RepID=UPI000FEC38E4|nr:hypothetical protein [Pantoea ananatis]QAB32072.1 hypothetical protein EPK90_20865 [Pantoea ananatis]
MDSFFTEDVIDSLSPALWAQTAPLEDRFKRQECFRLLWLGEALRKARNWTDLSAEQAADYAIAEHHGWFPGDVENLSVKHKWLALTEVKSALYAQPGGKSFRYMTEKKLDWLDSPWRFSAV